MGSKQGADTRPEDGTVPGPTVPPGTMDTLISAARRECAPTESGRPRPQTRDPSFPLHARGSKLSDAGRLGRHWLGTQNVKPDARTWCQEESTGPTPAIGQRVKATGVVDVTGCAHARQSEQRRMSQPSTDVLTLSPPPPPNGVRLSCAATVWFSQMQFYYDGRRQLQPLVRLRTNRWSLGSYPAPEPEKLPPVLTQAPQR